MKAAGHALDGEVVEVDEHVATEDDVQPPDTGVRRRPRVEREVQIAEAHVLLHLGRQDVLATLGAEVRAHAFGPGASQGPLAIVRAAGPGERRARHIGGEHRHVVAPALVHQQGRHGIGLLAGGTPRAPQPRVVVRALLLAQGGEDDAAQVLEVLGRPEEVRLADGELGQEVIHRRRVGVDVHPIRVEVGDASASHGARDAFLRGGGAAGRRQSSARLDEREDGREALVAPRPGPHGCSGEAVSAASNSSASASERNSRRSWTSTNPSSSLAAPAT